MSYVSQQNLLFDASTTANFDSMGSAISAALSSMGWTKTSDTGQVNWGSNPAAPGNGNSYYEIWQPNDALQTGSTKFYLRLDYAQIASTSPFALIFTLGTGTNGSGTLTGTVTKSVTTSGGFFAGSSNQGSGNYSDCYFSGDVDRMGMMLWRGFGGRIGAIVCIERTRNVAGGDSSDGVTLYAVGYGGYAPSVASALSGTGSNYTGAVQQTLLLSSPPVAGGFANNSLFYIDDGGNYSSALNNSFAVSPVFPWYGLFGNPNTELCLLKTQDIAETQEFQTTLYGSTRTYIATANIVGSGGQSGHLKTCMRFD